MGKTLVAYYSKSGNNSYLAKRFAETLGTDLIEVIPYSNNFMSIMLASLFGMGMPIKKLDLPQRSYNSLLICGPIWAGQLLAPLRSFLKKYCIDIPVVFFATCCGSNEENKNDKFGYEHVFTKIKGLLGERCKACEAFSITYAVPEDQRNNDKAVMNARLSDSTFSKELEERFNNFLKIIQET